MDKILLELDSKQEKEREISSMRQDIKTLKRKRQALADRDARLRSNINSGTELSAADTRLPLSVVSTNTEPTPGIISDSDVQELKRIVALKLKLKTTAICQGITSIRDEANDETKYMFDPYIGGKPFGPYVLRVRYSNSNKGIVLRGHSLPHTVPLKTLYTKHITDSQTSDKVSQMQSFLEDISRHLRGFLSRQQQFNDLKDRFSSDLLQATASHHFTALSFTLNIEDETSGSSRRVNISMLYDKDGERPKQDSLQIEVNPSLDEESLGGIKEQIEVFYEMSLSEAVNEAFDN